MAFSAHSRRHDSGLAPHRGPLAHLAELATALSREVQAAQMRAVLDRFPDRLLAQIGITRADIPAYAHDLVSGASENR